MTVRVLKAIQWLDNYKAHMKFWMGQGPRATIALKTS